MSMFKNIVAAALIGAASIAVSGCATTLPANVTRYQAMPAPQGQSFIVVPGEGMAGNGGLEFQRYAGLVAQQLAARGYQPANGPQSASMIVQVGYNVDRGTQRIVQDPFSYGNGGFGDPFWGRPYFSRFGYFGGFRSPYYYGWDDPFWYGRGIDSYVEYRSELDLHIRAAGTNQPLFDGRAQARSESDRLDVLVPNLVEAMFAGFPGRSGETIRISVPMRPR